MQVYRLHSSQPVANPVTSRASGGTVNAGSSGAKDTHDGVSAEPGSDVSALVSQLRHSPEVRQAVVEQARAKVAAGDYFTRSSAEATAEALLRHES